MPAFVAEFDLKTLLSIGGTALPFYLLFNGEKIEKSFEAWSRIFSELSKRAKIFLGVIVHGFQIICEEEGKKFLVFVDHSSAEIYRVTNTRRSTKRKGPRRVTNKRRSTKRKGP